MRTSASTLLLLLLFTPPLFCQGSTLIPGQLSGPVSEGMYDLAISSSSIYGVADQSLLNSTDGGGTWERREGPPGTMRGIEIDSDGTLWIATDEGLYSRASGSGTWEQVLEGDSELLVIDGEGTIFIGDIAGESIRRSDDGGESWTDLTTPGASFEALVPATGDTLWGLVDGAVLLSFDNGENWISYSELPSGSTPSWLMLLSSGEVLLIADDVYYRSNRSDGSWEELGDSPDTRVVSAAIELPDRSILVGYVADNGRTKNTDTALYRLSVESSDLDALPVTEELDVDLTPEAFAIDGNDRLYMATSYSDRQWGEPWIDIGQILASDDWGETWRTVYSTSFSGSYILGAGIYSEETIVAVRYPPVFPLEEEILIYRTDNGGNDWVDITPTEGDVRYSTYSILSDGSIYMTRGDTTLYRSVDTGRTWHRVMSGTPWIPSGEIIEIDPQNLLLQSRVGFSGRTIFGSSDGGENWEVRSSRETQEGVIDWAVGPSGEIYLAERTNVVVSLDSGATWTTRNVIGGGGGGNFITGITISEEGDPVVATFQRAIYISSNTGSTWEETTTSPGNQLTSIVTGPTGDLFVGDRTGMIHRSEDNGESWEIFTTIPEPTTAIRSLMIGAGDYLYIGTELRGLWRVSTSGRSDVRAELTTPERLNLR